MLRVIVLTLILLTSSWDLLKHGGTLGNTSLTFWLIAAVYGISPLNALALRFSKHPRRVGYVQLAIDLLLATSAAYVAGPTVSVCLYLVVIVVAAMVFSRQGVALIGSFALVCYGTLAFGFLPLSDASMSPGPQEILGGYIALLFVALTCGTLAKRLEVAGVLADRREQDLTELSKRQRQLLDDISDGVITMDLNTTITGLNQAARSIIGLSEIDTRNLIGKDLPTVFDECGFQGLDEPLDGSSYSQTPAELVSRGKDGAREAHLTYSLKPVIDSQGKETGKLFIFNDISHVKSMEERLSLHEKMAKLLSESDAVSSEPSFATADVRMIGESGIMKRVFHLVERVSASDASVLINGESGTGKELIAKAVHHQSPRRNNPFVAINCGAIPENLIESELFGHKKGAFTGAISENLGLFRQARGGTIFLDEIGELPTSSTNKTPSSASRKNYPSGWRRSRYSCRCSHSCSNETRILKTK